MLSRNSPLRIPHCLDNCLTDGGKFVSPTLRPRFTPQKHYFYVSGTQFCLRLGKPQGLVQLERLAKLKTIHPVGPQTRDLPA
jgi:hypothetical protein